MDLNLKCKRALVTGSSIGIGYAIAKGLAIEGAKVIAIAADLGRAEGAAELVGKAGHVDILVNNVGSFEPAAFTDDADWLRYFEVNVMSGVRLSRALLPGMVSRTWGRIVFISSESGIQTPKEMVHYGVTKTAQLALSRAIAESVAGTSVTSNSVLPGPTPSEGVVDFVEKLAADQQTDTTTFEREFVKTMRPSSLIGRFAETEEVANLVVFLCGAGSSAITGASLRVDSGVVRSII
ncbi:MAG: SDR family NAD(P)-dependent oxidoreductase [Methyloceanibacter sp.]